MNVTLWRTDEILDTTMTADIAMAAGPAAGLNTHLWIGVVDSGTGLPEGQHQNGVTSVVRVPNCTSLVLTLGSIAIDREDQCNDLKLVTCYVP